MNDDFDVISHNLSARLNYNIDISEALAKCISAQTYASGLKTCIVLIMCVIQTFFITCIFSSKDSARFVALSGSSIKSKNTN